MVIRDIDKINIPNYIWKKRKTITKDYEVKAFDTETENGTCILICDNDNRWFIPNHIDELLKYLMYKPYQYSINFFYNVKYDTNAIIKMLPDDAIKNLALFDETVYYDRNQKQYFISIIPDKLLKIRVGHHTVKFFDLAQFYNKKKLAVLAKKVNMEKYMLDETNKNIDIDITCLSKKRMMEDKIYKNEIIKRCYIDCLITKKLGDKLNNAVSRFVKLRNFYSGASMSRQLVLQNLNDKYLNLPSLKFMDMALKAYNAGRFEILKRGYFPTMIERDINSAYPYEIANLYECDGTYIYNKEYIPDSIHSFFNCDLEIYDTTYSPFKFQLPKSKKDLGENKTLPTNLLVYPVGKFTNQFLSKSDYETILNQGYPIKINYAAHIINSEPIKPFEYVDELYYYRKDLQHGNKNKKIEKDKDLADTIKRTLNSIYGTFINVNKESGLTQTESEYTDDYTVIDNEIWFTKNKTTAGNMFNPVWATEICANVRNRLYNDFIPYEDKIICIATDGIKLTSDVNIKESNKLGDYDKSKITEGILIGSGVYQFGNETKFRGFASYKNDDDDDDKDNKKKTLKEILNENSNENIIASVVNRVINLKYAYKNNYVKLVDDDGEIYKKHMTLEDINSFVKINRDLNINFDKKRDWNRDFKNCEDVLTNIIDSKPLSVKDIKLSVRDKKN